MINVLNQNATQFGNYLNRHIDKHIISIQYIFILHFVALFNGTQFHSKWLHTAAQRESQRAKTSARALSLFSLSFSLYTEPIWGVECAHSLLAGYFVILFYLYESEVRFVTRSADHVSVFG